MTTTAFNAIAMTRQIREQHAAQLHNTTPSERIAFYRAKARTMETIASQPTNEIVVPQHTAEEERL